MSHLALKPGHSRFIQKYSRNISSVLGSPTKGRVKKKRLEGSIDFNIQETSGRSRIKGQIQDNGELLTCW